MEVINTILFHDEIKKAYPRIFKLQTLKDGHHFDYQDRRKYLKNASIIMTSNVGSTSTTKSGSNIIEFSFGKEEHRLLA